MKIYQVGGSVRDEIIGVQPHDYDYCVVGSTIKEMLQLGYKRVGKGFPVFLKDGKEYALARTERKTGNKHTDFKFKFGKNVTLEEDLSRRDLTINSIAKDCETGEYIDPYNGIRDIKNKIIRITNPEAFDEDPLRVLRVATYAAKTGFNVDVMTIQHCREMVEKGMLQYLSPERIWKEIEKGLSTNNFKYFIEVLSYTKALGVIFPEIDALKNVQEIPEHHPEKTTYNHTLLTLEFADKENLSQIVKYALLFHDVGKLFTPKDVLPHHYGHEEAGLSVIDKQKIPNNYKDFAKMACKYHMILRRFYEMKPGRIYDVMYDITKGFRYFIPLKLLFQVSEADLYGRGKEPREERKNQFDKSQEIAYNMYSILEKVSASDFQELIDKSDKLSGKEFGELYREKLIQYYCERRKVR